MLPGALASAPEVVAGLFCRCEWSAAALLSVEFADQALLWMSEGLPLSTLWWSPVGLGADWSWFSGDLISVRSWLPALLITFSCYISGVDAWSSLGHLALSCMYTLGTAA